MTDRSLRSLCSRSTTRRQLRVVNGFSLPEQLLVVVILGVLASLAIPSFFFVLRRERVNAVALEAAGWLEEVRSSAARQVSADPTQGGCRIVLAGSFTGLGEGTPLAGTSCSARVRLLRIPMVQGALFNVATSVSEENIKQAPSSQACLVEGVNVCKTGAFQLVFSPRGMWSLQDVEGELGDVEIRIALNDGQGPKRCVRLSSILGSIDIGTSDNPSLSSPCSSYGSL